MYADGPDAGGMYTSNCRYDALLTPALQLFEATVRQRVTPAILTAS